MHAIAVCNNGLSYKLWDKPINAHTFDTRYLFFTSRGKIADIVLEVEDIKKYFLHQKDMLHAVDDENARWGGNDPVSWEIETLGVLPVAPQTGEATIAKIRLYSIACVGLEYKRHPEGAGPTDSNIAIKNGITAITMGRGGGGDGGHSVEEWFEPFEEYKGPQKDLLALLSMVGVTGVSVPGLEIRKWFITPFVSSVDKPPPNKITLPAQKAQTTNWLSAPRFFSTGYPSIRYQILVGIGIKCREISVTFTPYHSRLEKTLKI